MKSFKRIVALIIVMIAVDLCIWGIISHQRHSSEIPDNVIDPDPPVSTPKANLELQSNNDTDNLPFAFIGMDGEESVSILYRIRAIYNSTFTLKYDMTVRDSADFELLAEILMIKVELSGSGTSPLYDGLLKDMPTLEIPLSASNMTVTDKLFTVTAYLESPVSEPYYSQRLMADMTWWIDGQDSVSVSNNEFTTMAKPSTPPPVDPDDPDDPDNPDPPTPPTPPVVITPDLSFTTVNSGDNSPFTMRDTVNGDGMIRYFAFDVIHGDNIKMIIDSRVITDTSLGAVLWAKLELVGGDGNVTLYEGLLKNLTAEHLLAKNDSNKTRVYYKLTVTADGLTEAYCEKRLNCDLVWSLAGTSEQLKVSNNVFVGYDKPTDPGGSDNPNPPTPPNPPVDPDPPTPPSPPVVIEPTVDFVTINPGDNTEFGMTDIRDGDSETKNFAFEVTHGEEITVKIKNNIEVDSILSEVLWVRIELDDIPTVLKMRMRSANVIYEGLLKDLEVEHTIAKNDANLTNLYYKVTVYAVGLTEEYCGNELVCDITWTLGDTDEQLKVSNHTFVSYEKPTPPPVVITPDLSFGSVNSGDNTPFDMEELKDGDSAVKYFAFNVVHPENITVSIHTLVSIDTGLSEVLKAKLELVGTDGNVTLYEGPLNVLAAEHTLTQNDSNRTAVYYKLTVTADGLTEEYCEKRFVCELAWSLAGTSEQLRVSNNYFEGYRKPVTPPDPPTPEFATDIELTSRDGYDNIAFNVEDMLPGDSVSQYYCVSVTHKSNHNVSFSVKLDEGQKLADVMRIKVELLLPDADDVVLYDGYMENCSDVNVSVYAEDETVTAVYYRITAYTNGSEVGNEYVGESLTASLSWTLE